ncbi:DUF6776 family protein [Ideonella sp.]|uniref:DUF6776 family protein n=1 Tax=Ideonella sp. TaxID=1929293 RepID=UPI002B496EF2|nr:DUF6776 family protein [Ideonella sp.]HJV67751.1 DUF6776 family protein [Ideonella sp.]
MRFKLLRRRLSISAPRMIVRSHLPWPLRWAVAAVVLGFSAAIALWAFEFGKDIAGLDRGGKEEVAHLRAELASLREQNERAQTIANTADSLLKAEKAAQEKLAEQLKQTEADNLALKADLGFFERLLPVAGAPGGLAVRGFQAEPVAPGQLRYQLLVMQNGRPGAPFDGRYELTLSGLLDGRPWTAGLPGGAQPLQVKQYARVEGRIEHPAGAVVKTVQVRVLNGTGAVMATQMAALGS